LSQPEGRRWSELAPAKLNLALHVRRRRPDGLHDIETLFAFCTDGDRLTGAPAETLSLTIAGPFAADLAADEENLVLRAARALQTQSGCTAGAALQLDKQLPVASGLGGGSADAAAALRLLCAMWKVDPAHASAVAPSVGADVPACLLSLPAYGSGLGDQLRAVSLDVSGRPALLVNLGVGLSTAQVFAAWDGTDGGPLQNWREGRNDLEPIATGIVPEIADVLRWLRDRPGADTARMSGSGATCFALFEDADARDAAAAAVPSQWWHLPTYLR
jgi:4-diphosphocytidyl-2-C-methyl-D-erythritol kinase